MSMYDLIVKKKRGIALSREEIEWMIDCLLYTSKTVKSRRRIVKQKTDAMKRIKLYYRIIIGCCICFLIVGVIFTVYMISDNEEKNRSYFKEVTANTSNTLRCV